MRKTIGFLAMTACLFAAPDEKARKEAGERLTEATTVFGEILRVDVITNGPAPEVKLQSELLFKVAFDNGMPVEETLAQVGDVVEHVLKRIEGMFPTRSELTLHE